MTQVVKKYVDRLCFYVDVNSLYVNEMAKNYIPY